MGDCCRVDWSVAAGGVTCWAEVAVLPLCREAGVAGALN